MNSWFRMYAEFASDPKVQIMSEAMQRRLVMLLCLRCGNVLETLQEQEVAYALRISDEDLAETKALFQRRGFVDEHWNILHWDKRQFASDSSTYRVHEHRKRRCNVSETPPDTDTDTDTDTEKTLLAFDCFWSAYPRKASKAKARKAWMKLKPSPELLATMLSALVVWTKTDQWLSEDGRFVPYPTSWLNGECWNDAVPQGRTDWAQRRLGQPADRVGTLGAGDID